MSYDNGETFESALAWGPYSNDDMKFIWIELCFSWLCKDTYSSELESQGTDRQWNTNTKPWSDVCNVHCYSSRWKFKCGWSCVKKETHTGISTREKLLWHWQRQRHFCSGEKATATFVPNQIGDRSVGKWATRTHQKPPWWVVFMLTSWIN